MSPLPSSAIFLQNNRLAQSGVDAPLWEILDLPLLPPSKTTAQKKLPINSTGSSMSYSTEIKFDNTNAGGFILILSHTIAAEAMEPFYRKLVDERAWRMLNRKLVSSYIGNEEGSCCNTFLREIWIIYSPAHVHFQKLFEWINTFH